MPIINAISGDLLSLFEDQKYNAIAHGCNTFVNFGGGIALSIKNKYPEAFETDRKAGSTKQNYLGNYSVCELKDTSQFIFNLYTQDTLGWNKLHDAPPADYTAVYRAFLKLNKDYKDKDNFKIAIPLISAGLAKGNWPILQQLINLATPDLNIDLILYRHKG